MATKHTPGPWAVEDIKSQGTMVYRRIHVGKTALGAISAYKLPKGRDAEAEANARLIAAAPELLAALEIAEGFISGFEGDELQEGVDWMLSTIRAAIAKAEGAQ